MTALFRAPLSVALMAGAVGLCAAANAEDVDLTLAEGFSISVFHDGVGKGTRHMAVRDNGDVLISRQDGTLIALRDEDDDGRADRSFERSVPITSGLRIHDGYVYFSDNVSVSRLKLDDGLLPEGAPEVVVDGFLEQGSHATKDFAISPSGDLFVNVGAPSNACQAKQRTPGAPGQDPCPERERQGGIWRFNAGQLGQSQLTGERYVTGTRNIVALSWNPSVDALYFVVHGRDQLSFLWPEYFTDQQNAEMPAEEFHRARANADYGWPYTFVDPATGRRLQAPEYGGDGQQLAADGYETPLHNYPAHWAPNDLTFYRGENFPSDFADGALIAWRGSWNRAPEPQDGYRVTFQPMSDGLPSGEPEDLITGFAGPEPISRSSEAVYRPGGLAIDGEGRLYVSDTEKGRIWRIEYGGDS